MASVAPDATESQHSRGFSYYYKEHGGPVSAGICQIGIFRDHIRLGFIHGAFLPDPEGLLVGEPKYKKHVRIYHYEQAPGNISRQLILASSRFDPYTLKERVRMMARHIKTIRWLGILLILGLCRMQAEWLNVHCSNPHHYRHRTIPQPLATPYAQEPAAGICASFEGEMVTVSLNPDIPDPRCAKVRRGSKAHRHQPDTKYAGSFDREL